MPAWLPRFLLGRKRRRQMILNAIDCAAPREVIVIEAPAPSVAEATLDALLDPLQPLREQFMAVTGMGLDVDAAENPSPVRYTLPAAGSGIEVSFLAAGDPDGKRVLFIHGSPGVAEEWGNFLIDVPVGYYHIAVDRPGFGGSEPDRPFIGLVDQARAISPLLHAHDGQKVILVGYSFGGPVALRLAADFPELVGGVMLIGSAADPTEEEVHPLQSLAAMEMFAGLLPSELANSNAELLALKEQLEHLARDLGHIGAPVTVVQGLRDTLVPPENAVYLQTRLSGTSVRLMLVEEGDHFLPWTHRELLEKALSCVINDGRSPEDSGSGDPTRERAAQRSE